MTQIDGKVCSACGEYKPYQEFYRNSTYLDGYAGKCKECKKAYQQEWREANRKKHRDYSRAYHHEHREERLAYYSGWLEGNAHVKEEGTRRWREANPERMTAIRKVQNARRRALIANADGRYTPQEWLDLKEHYGNQCLACGRREPEVKITPDHVVPLSVGGSNSIENIQPLCWGCNASKQARIMDYRDNARVRHQTAGTA